MPTHHRRKRTKNRQNTNSEIAHRVQFFNFALLEFLLWQRQETEI
jgi:hypothetical protein